MTTEKSETAKIKNTKEQWILLVTLCVVTFLGAMIFSIQAPFYPYEAESKGATPSEYGFVLGTFGLTQFILGPIFGSYLLKIGVRNAFHGGILAASISTILFGFLNSIEGRVPFVLLSFLLRIVEAAGALAMSIATYTFAATDFPGSVGRTFAIIETVYGIGMSFGPSVGVALFNMGGFTLPFVALGFVHFLSGVVTYLVLPKAVESEKKQVAPFDETATGEKKKALGFIALLKVPAVTMYACSIISAILTSSFIVSLMEPNLRQFNLSSTMFSVMFLLQGNVQALFSFFWGYICDRIPRPEFITILGSALLTVSAFSIGPSSFLPYQPNLGVTAVCLVGVGLANSAILVSAFVQGLKEATNNGFPVSESTSGLISGLFMSSIALGCSAGPLIGGVLYQYLRGFRHSTSVLALFDLVLTLSLIVFALTKKPCPNLREGTQKDYGNSKNEHILDDNK